MKAPVFTLLLLVLATGRTTAKAVPKPEAEAAAQVDKSGVSRSGGNPKPVPARLGSPRNKDEVNDSSFQAQTFPQNQFLGTGGLGAGSQDPNLLQYLQSINRGGGQLGTSTFGTTGLSSFGGANLNPGFGSFGTGQFNTGFGTTGLGTGIPTTGNSFGAGFNSGFVPGQRFNTGFGSSFNPGFGTLGSTGFNPSFGSGQGFNTGFGTTGLGSGVLSNGFGTLGNSGFGLGTNLNSGFPSTLGNNFGTQLGIGGFRQPGFGSFGQAGLGQFGLGQTGLGGFGGLNGGIGSGIGSGLGSGLGNGLGGLNGGFGGGLGSLSGGLGGFGGLAQSQFGQLQPGFQLGQFGNSLGTTGFDSGLGNSFGSQFDDRTNGLDTRFSNRINNRDNERFDPGYNSAVIGKIRPIDNDRRQTSNVKRLESEN